MAIFTSGGYNLLRVRFTSIWIAVILTLSTALEVSAELLPDFNGNGIVDIPDFLLFVDHFGTRRGDETYESRYDLDGDGEISVSDFLIFVDHFGKSAGSSEEDLVLTSLAVTGGIGEMYPTFDPDVRHYAIRCEDATKLQVKARAKGEEMQLKLNNIEMSGRDVDEAVVVDSDHDIAIELSDGQNSVTYVVHCIPSDFPEIRVARKQAGVSDGLMFMNLGIKGTNPPFFMVVMDNNGVPRFHRRFSSRRSHFQRHTTGPTIDGRKVHYSVAKQVPEPREFSFLSEVELFDESFELIKTVETVSPVTQVTSHDFLITDEGNFMFMAYNPAQRDFGEHGVHNTTDPVIQEVTPLGEEIYRWVGFDHLTIDPDFLWNDFKRDYAHINSIQMIEGDIIVSLRGGSQVLRIDRSAKSATNPGTSIVWQLGGTDKGEEFPDDRVFLTIEGDDEGMGEFCAQHQPTLTDAGTLVLFDNGGGCLSAWIGESPDRGDLEQFSRVVEYAIDPVSGQASFIRQFRLDPKYGYTPWWGGVTVLDNGNWLIAWRNDRGYDESLAIEERAIAISEVDATGTEVFRLNAYSENTYWTTYRAYREPEAEIKIPLNLP